MKRLFTLLVALIFAYSGFSQVPEKMSYQAVVRNANDELVKSSPVGMQISVLRGSESGTPVYVETQSTSTNDNGLLTIEIGGGTPETGTFAEIDWTTGVYFLKTETDPAGGTNYTITGTSQLLSVPYAFFAKTSGSSTDAVKLTGDQTITGNKTFSGTTTVATPVNVTDAATKGYVDELKAQIEELQISAGIAVKDIDGNIYKTITIGTQIWMAENLKTSKYSNGDAIPNVIDNTQWENLTSGAYCYYNNDSANYYKIYGALYNFYAVIDNRNLCPSGWHVPTDVEWSVLENYLISNGYNYDGTTTGDKIGKSLASTTLWWPSSFEGAVGNTDFPSYRNSTGFNGLPGGGRSEDGGFSVMGGMGYWWTSYEDFSINALEQRLDYNHIELILGAHKKTHGFSVRCVKD